jgi:hypothetical protein
LYWFHHFIIGVRNSAILISPQSGNLVISTFSNCLSPSVLSHIPNLLRSEMFFSKSIQFYANYLSIWSETVVFFSEISCISCSV